MARISLIINIELMVRVASGAPNSAVNLLASTEASQLSTSTDGTALIKRLNANKWIDLYYVTI